MTKTIPFFGRRSLSRAYRRVFLVCFFTAFLMIFIPILFSVIGVNGKVIFSLLFVLAFVTHFAGNKSESYLDDQKGISQIERRKPFTETKEFVEAALSAGVGVGIISVIVSGVIVAFLSN